MFNSSGEYPEQGAHLLCWGFIEVDVNHECGGFFHCVFEDVGNRYFVVINGFVTDIVLDRVDCWRPISIRTPEVIDV